MVYQYTSITIRGIPLTVFPAWYGSGTESWIATRGLKPTNTFHFAACVTIWKV
jgi:hypothetical protein